jgi:hypothetical protein
MKKERKYQIVFENQLVIKLEDRHFKKPFNVAHALHSYYPDLILIPEEYRDLINTDNEFGKEIIYKIAVGGEIAYY